MTVCREWGMATYRILKENCSFYKSIVIHGIYWYSVLEENYFGTFGDCWALYCYHVFLFFVLFGNYQDVAPDVKCYW